ncbi:MAG: hypothetical protein ABI430_00980 [Candidatus Taylorbacteria bacterium]
MNPEKPDSGKRFQSMRDVVAGKISQEEVEKAEMDARILEAGQKKGKKKLRKVGVNPQINLNLSSPEEKKESE